jgi:hypothetical protein
MKSPDEITSQTARRAQGRAKSACFVHSDNVVGVLGDFPELTKAVRKRDEAAVSILCAQLFDLNSAAKLRPRPTPIAS